MLQICGRGDDAVVRRESQSMAGNSDSDCVSCCVQDSSIHCRLAFQRVGAVKLSGLVAWVGRKSIKTFVD
jgi:hypothetical protein